MKTLPNPDDRDCGVAEGYPGKIVWQPKPMLITQSFSSCSHSQVDLVAADFHCSNAAQFEPNSAAINRAIQERDAADERTAG